MPCANFFRKLRNTRTTPVCEVSHMLGFDSDYDSAKVFKKFEKLF